MLEARDRVGGRVLNQEIGDGKVVEMGGKWVGPGQTVIAELLKELELSTFPTYNDGDSLWCQDGKISRYRGMIPKVNPLGLLDFAAAQQGFDKLARSIPLDGPWTARNAERLDGRTFESWIRANAHTPLSRELFRIYCNAVFAAEARDVSLLHALFYTHAGKGVDSLASVKGGAQQDRIVGGSQQIAFRMAQGLGDCIRLSSPVRRIEQTGTVATIKTDDGSLQARAVIVAIPPVIASRIDYRPALPAARDQLTQRVPQGSVIKCYAIYAKPFWREEGLNGNVVSNRGPIKFTYDISPPDGSPGVIVGYFEGATAREFGAKSRCDRKRAMIECLVRYLGPRAANPQQYLELDWSEEEWTRGCYSGHFPTGVWTSFGPALRKPCGRIFWAGTETATEWNGYMMARSQLATEPPTRQHRFLLRIQAQS